MDRSEPTPGIDCAAALQANAAWLAGRELPCARAQWSAHLRACTECDSDLRTSAALRAGAGRLSSEPDNAPRGLLRTFVPRRMAASPRRGSVVLLLLGATLLAAFHALGRGARLEGSSGQVRRLEEDGTLADAAPGRLAPGTIVVLGADARAEFASHGLQLSVEGPARVRVAERGLDLLAGVAQAAGAGRLGTSRGPLELDDARLSLRESRDGLELDCAAGKASLGGERPAQLHAGERLDLRLAALR